MQSITRSIIVMRMRQKKQIGFSPIPFRGPRQGVHGAARDIQQALMDDAFGQYVKEGDICTRLRRVWLGDPWLSDFDGSGSVTFRTR